MQEATIRGALKLACDSNIEETTMHAQLIESQLVRLEKLGEVTDGGLLLYQNARAVGNQISYVMSSSMPLCVL